MINCVQWCQEILWPFYMRKKWQVIRKESQHLAGKNQIKWDDAKYNDIYHI